MRIPFHASVRATREIATKALPDKRAETVTRAAAEIIPDLVQEEGNDVVAIRIVITYLAEQKLATMTVLTPP